MCALEKLGSTPLIEKVNVLAWAVVAHTFNPSAQEAEARQISVSGRPTWSTEQVPGQPGLLHRESLFRKIKTNQKKKKILNLKKKKKKFVFMMITFMFNF